MRRFRFDLEKLLELREYREREAELNLARAMGELASLEARIREIAEERARVAAGRFAPGFNAANIRNAEAYILRLDKTKDSLIESAAEAELVVEAARDAFMEAAKDRKVLAKLKDKRASEHRKTAALEEFKVLDDISGGSAARRAVSGE